MITVLRKHRQWLMIVIAILCIPFIFYFSKSDLSRIAKNDLGHIYDRTVSNVEFQRSARLFTLAQQLGMFSFITDMVVGATSQNDAYVEFTWNHLVLHHEAERLGLKPSSSEVVSVVRNLRPFQGEKGFDPNKYNEFVQSALPQLGFNEAQIEELAADQLLLERLKGVLSAGVSVPESEAHENYEQAYGKLNVSVVRVRSEDVAKDLQVTDDAISKYYEAHKAELNTEEKRKVTFVTFGLNEEQKKLTGKERIEALQKLADRANDFNQALLEKGAQFEQVAAKFELPIQTSGEFTRTKPDPLLKGSAQLAEAAFQLKTEEPNSDATQAGDSFFILHLAGIEPAQPLSLEAAKPKIVDAIKQQQTREKVSTKASEAVAKIRQALQSGTALEAALQQTGLPAEKIAPFALMDPPPTPPKPPEPGKSPEPVPPVAPDLQMIKSAVVDLKPGEVSEFIPTEAGGVVAVLEKRDQPDPANYEMAKASFSARVLKSKRDVAFYEWLRERRREAGVAPAREEQGQVDQDAG